MLLNVQNVQKYYGDRLIFSIDSLKIYQGDKIGIVGANGAGKSTLMKVLCGILPPDRGKVESRCVISYVDQLGADSALPSSIQSGIFQAVPDPKSGGEIMRKKLAAAFSLPFDLLCLDEPASNLDSDGINTLSAMLATVDTLVLVSHNRQLLQAHCNKIIQLQNGSLSIFSGTFSEYCLAEKALKQRKELEYNDYIRNKKRLENSIKEASQRASKIKKAPSRMGNSEARLHKRESSAKQAKILNAAAAVSSRLGKLDVVQKPQELNPIKIDFSLTNPPYNKIVLSASSLNFSYESNKIFANARFEVANGAHVALVGPNGAGKSTLLKLICERDDLVYKAPKLKLGILNQNFLGLDFAGTVLSNVLSTAVQPQTVCRITLANLGFLSDDVHKSICVLSGGELIKISLAKLIVSDCNGLVLDEPTNYLDLDSLVKVQAALTRYEGTVIFVSHEQAFVSSVATHVLQLKNKQIFEVST